jgi:UvrD-like helicase C-terminal domain
MLRRAALGPFGTSDAPLEGAGLSVELQAALNPAGDRKVEPVRVDLCLPAVILPVLTQHYAALQRNFLYTGVTRGKRLVVMVGQTKAVAIAVRNASARRRWSRLAEWLSTKKIEA